jgi:hypothetical protein
LNPFGFWSKSLITINHMQQHVRTTMFLHPTMNFNLTKKFISLCFHEYKKYKIKSF